jgi:23S rRNA pseudouridine1911/1915/1917 synthase
MLDVLWIDNHLLAVNKPAGLPTVPDSSRDESLLDRARELLRVRFEKPGAVYLGVVHRLDRPVSGVVLFARTSKAANRLSALFRSRDVEKTYWGVSSRAPSPEQGFMEQWLLKDPRRNRVRVVEPGTCGAQLARTRWKRLASSGRGRGRRFLIELVPETGRPHQLRMALSSLGAPLLGDLKYGAPEPLPDASIALHARRLVLAHPVGGKRVEIVGACPVSAIWSFPLIADGPRAPSASRPSPDRSG